MVTIEPFRIAAAGDLERRRALAAGGRVLEELPRLLPPRPAVARAQVGEAVRRLRDLRRLRAAELVEDRPALARADGRDGDDRGDGDDDRERAGQRPPPLRARPRLPAARYASQADDRGADDRRRRRTRRRRSRGSAYGWRSSVSAGRENAQSATRPATGVTRTSVPSVSSRSRSIASQASAATRGDGDPGARVRQDDDELGEVDEQGSGGAGGRVERAGSRPPRGRTEPRSPRRARASSSSRPGCAGARRGRRRGRATGPPCRAAPRRARARAAAPARRRPSAPAAATRVASRPSSGEGRVGEQPVEGRPREVGRDRPPHRQPDPGGQRGEEHERGQPGAARDRHARRRAASTAAAITASEPIQNSRPSEVPSPKKSAVTSSAAAANRARPAGEHGGLHRRPTLAEGSHCAPGFNRPLTRASSAISWRGVETGSGRPTRGITYSAQTRVTSGRRSGGHGPRPRVTRSIRHILVALLIVGAATAASSAAAAGTAAKSTPPCWKVLINDWYDGRIDGIYEIHCYRDALKHLPADVDTYSSARDDIKQALQKRITQGQQRRRTTTTNATATTHHGRRRRGGGGTPAGPSGGGTLRPAAAPATAGSASGPIKSAFDADEAGEGRLAAGPAARPGRRRARADGGRRSRVPRPQDAPAAGAGRLGRVRSARARPAAARAA